MTARAPLRVVARAEHTGARIDQFLAAATSLSRRKARELLGSGAVAINGRIVRIASRPIEAGDVVDMLEADPTLTVRLPPTPAVTVLYEDDDLLVADKPAGVLSQPAEGRAEGELAFDEQVLLDLARRTGRRPFLRLIHRIDRTTSGLLLFARSPAALAPLAECWAAGSVERVYVARVEGRPEWEETTIDAPIARASDGAWRFEISPRGKAATTRARVLERDPETCLVECRLVTGRTHQVRVHLAHAGFPVAGDRLYGARDPRAKRPLLHAAELALPHPRTGTRLHVVSPLPEDLRATRGMAATVEPS